ncbi:Surface polysaccharide O-acyltransferase, integral membrane enzyme [Allochromatium warmingii]|uniref:Surface polysaccharide O-acyltransferase, integral membrane enzyme n=1 Tax=Allochromatium warmingii TaxID=61595 RepID=A0A1H3J8G4_ALLWA|nr:acyltransferase family protein [Allochromatium warmingii]SDY35859.1 Surface polysaccharide O-acyltransferase, integral membrane enzyme [Allochromatium warmingii]
MCSVVFHDFRLFVIRKNEDLSNFLKKRLSKVVLPLIVWSAIYIFWKNFETNSPVTLISFFSILFSPAYYHLWFLYAIIGVYFFVPILRIFVIHADKKVNYYYYIFLWFFAVSIIPFMEKFTSIKSSFDFLSVSGFFGYCLLGFFLGKNDLFLQKVKKLLFIFIIFFGFTVFGTYILTARNENHIFDEYFYGYLSPNVVIMSVTAFLLIKILAQKQKAIFFENAKFLNVLSSFSSASFGIYFIHAIFLSLLSQGFFGFTLNGFIRSAWYSIPATAILTFFFSYLTVIAIKKVPILKKIVP